MSENDTITVSQKFEDNTLHLFGKYASKIGAPGPIEFLVEAIAFCFDTHGAPPLKTSDCGFALHRCNNEERPQGNGAVFYNVAFVFGGASARSVFQLIGQSSDQEASGWLRSVIDEYMSFIDSRVRAGCFFYQPEEFRYQ